MMGNQHTNSSQTVLSRGLVEIVYSSTSGTSKLAADRLQELLEDNKYLSPVMNIGDYLYQDLINHEGTVIFLLSTYGDGSSPSDGQAFLQWIEQLKPNNQFSKLNFAVCAFGNSNFEKHCGFGLEVQRILKQGGANQIQELVKCDAAANDRNIDARFPSFSKELVSILNIRNPLREISRSLLGSPFQVTCEERHNFDWQQNAAKLHNLAQEFTSYWNMQKCKVVHMKEMRSNSKDGRSTLWVRLEINSDMRLNPACNVEIFPINCLESDPRDSQIVSFSEVKGKIPYPPMPLRELRKLLDYRQKATNKQIKNALLLSTAEPSLVEDYHNKLKSKENLQLTIEQLMIQLRPKLEFLPFINFNRVRTYTLSSWDQDHRYLDLTAAITPKGLASSYFQTYPEYIRIKPIDSTFYIPQNRPLVMIANGSGIAPFRSIMQYIISNNQKLPYIRLYFGIQNNEVDFYYGEEWLQFQKKQILQLKLAQSRKNSHIKQYVQNLLEQDQNWLQEHIFRNNGVVFICGGGNMCKDVGNVIFNTVAAETKVPYKAFALVSKLKQQKTIVEQAFDS